MPSIYVLFQVHIGNGIYIKEDLWLKVSSGKVKLSLVAKDIAEDVWGYVAAAEFSLTGGVSPRYPGKEPKKAAPIAVVEAIYGKHCKFNQNSAFQHNTIKII